MMLEAASQRGLMTPDRWEAALKDGADLHQVPLSPQILKV